MNRKTIKVDFGKVHLSMAKSILKRQSTYGLICLSV